MLVAVAAPNTGVTSVGDVFITNVVPVPVCEAIDVALPTDVITPVKLAFVTTVAACPSMLVMPVNAMAAVVRLIAIDVVPRKNVCAAVA